MDDDDTTGGRLPVFDENDVAIHGWLFGHTEDGNAAITMECCSCEVRHALIFRPGSHITAASGDGHLVVHSVIFQGTRHPGPAEPV